MGLPSSPPVDKHYPARCLHGTARHGKDNERRPVVRRVFTRA